MNETTNDPSPADQPHTGARLHPSGFIQSYLMETEIGLERSWSLTNGALARCRMLEEQLEETVLLIAHSPRADIRYTAGAGLLYDIALQNDLDGIEIAIDHAVEILASDQPMPEHVQMLFDAEGPTFAFEPAVVFADMDVDDVMATVAAISDANVRAILFEKLVACMRQTPDSDWATIAWFLRGARAEVVCG